MSAEVNRMRNCRFRLGLFGALAVAAAELTLQCPMTVPSAIAAGPEIGAGLLAEGFASPVGLVAPADGTGRLFIADQAGVVRVFRQGVLAERPFLDVRDRMVRLDRGYDERGLLGLAFHPRFRENGRVFVKYSAPLRKGAPKGWDHTDLLAEYRIAADDPDRVDPGSERIVLAVDHPSPNHNGGTIVFGPDGYLYLSEGDGGGANDSGKGHAPEGNGQNLQTLLGKIMRIDVDGPAPYGIPPDNPFARGGGRPEIYAYGLRNAYAFSFDPAGTHELWAADVGQAMWEEIDRIVPGGNYGWRIREGRHCFDPDNPRNPPAECPRTGARGEPLIEPVLELANTANPNGRGLTNAVIGGFVYRGRNMPEFAGDYIFGGFSRSDDRADGSLFLGIPSDAGWSLEEFTVRLHGAPATGPAGRLGAYVKALGQDPDGEIYVLTCTELGPTGTTGKVFRLERAQATGIR